MQIQYSTFHNSVPFDLLVNEIWSLKFWYLSKIFLINSDIPIYEWLMNFQLAVSLLWHYTWVAIMSLSLNKIFLSLSRWSIGQSGSLIQVKGFSIWVRISEGDKTFLKFIFRKKCLKNSQKLTQKSDKIINRSKRTLLWNVL